MCLAFVVRLSNIEDFQHQWILLLVTVKFSIVPTTVKGQGIVMVILPVIGNNWAFLTETHEGWIFYIHRNKENNPIEIFLWSFGTCVEIEQILFLKKYKNHVMIKN